MNETDDEIDVGSLLSTNARHDCETADAESCSTSTDTYSTAIFVPQSAPIYSSSAAQQVATVSYGETRFISRKFIRLHVPRCIEDVEDEATLTMHNANDTSNNVPSNETSSSAFGNDSPLSNAAASNSPVDQKVVAIVQPNDVQVHVNSDVKVSSQCLYHSTSRCHVASKSDASTIRASRNAA
jgi:hypothetical protein